jgi:FkbM family methyltransferase
MVVSKHPFINFGSETFEFSSKKLKLQPMFYRSMIKDKILLDVYKKTKKVLGGRGLTKFSTIRAVKDLANSHLKSEYVTVNGSKMHLDPKDCLKLSINEIFEPLETNLVKNEVHSDDVVIDVGANVGYYTLLMAKLTGQNGKVFSFEPEPSNFNLLKENVEINSYQNVTLEQKAVANMNGKTKLYLCETNTEMHRLYQSNSKKFNKSIEVDVTTLDDYFKKSKYLNKINFIKIDAEGSELDVLKGMKTILKENIKLKIMLEFIPRHLLGSGSEPQELIEFLQNQNFQLSYVNQVEKRIEPVNDPKKLLDSYDDGKNLFCQRI